MEGGASVAAAGLKEKSGRALTDFCRGQPGAEPRRPVGYACSDIGRPFDAYAGAEDGSSGLRWGKLKSGLGMSSMGPALEALRRWYSGEPTPADCDVWVTCCRGKAI